MITNELRARIFAAYMPCSILINDLVTSTCVGVNIKERMLLVEVDYNDTGIFSLSAIDIEQCKLILKPLSEITDEYAIEVAKIIMPQYFANRKNGWLVARNYTVTGYPYIKIHNPKKVYSVQIDCKLVNFDIDGMEDRETGSHDMKPVAVIDYLRSAGYDLGYGQIPSLIDAGIAVKAV